MRLAYFSPLPPKRTGIATYSRHLIPALAQRLELTLFDHGQVDWPQQRVLDYVAQPSLSAYDGCLYQLGNNPHYHLEIFRVLRQWPGVVVLHDAVLYFLMAGQGLGGLIKELCLNYGAGHLSDYWRIAQDSPDGDILRYPYPERYPLLKSVLACARGVIVHSDTTRQQLLATGYNGAVEVIPHLIYPEMITQTIDLDIEPIRAALGIQPNERIFGCFGFIGRPKRMDVVLTALERLRGRWPFRLLIVGVGDTLLPQIRAHRLEKYVIQPGFVDDAAFNRYLAATDVVVNLRYPSMGEASGTLIQALSYGKACIVTNHAWFAELPDECVYKIGYGETEVDQLEEALQVLSQDDGARATLGAAARRYVEEHCLPDQVATRYAAVLTAVADAPLDDTAIAPAVLSPAVVSQVTAATASHFPDGWAERYFIERVRAAVQF